MSHRQPSGQRAQRWAPNLGTARLVGGGRTAAMLRRDAVVQWWCAPDFDDAPVCCGLRAAGGRGPRRRSWKAAREAVGDRILASLDDRGLLSQSYGDGDGYGTPDAAALMTVAFRLLGRDDPRASRLVDALIARLGAGPYLYRYPPDGGGFSGTEGAFLPVSFLAVTALAKLGRGQEARGRLDRLCAELPRLLAEEVAPQSGRMLGNAPLVWSHAELARALYVLNAEHIRDQWGAAGLWAWRLYRHLALRHQQARRRRDRPQQLPGG